MKKNQHGFGIIEIIVILAIVVVLGLLGWIVITRLQNLAKNSTAPGGNVSGVQTPDDVVRVMKADIASQYTVYGKTDNNIPDGQVQFVVRELSPNYKVAGDDYYITYKGGSSLYASTAYKSDSPPPSQTDKNLRALMAKKLGSLGFARTGQIDGTYEGIDGKVGIYTTATMVCSLPDENNEQYGASSDVACGYLAEYAKEAVRVKPFAALVDTTDSLTSISIDSIEDSPVAGYQRASVGVGSLGGGGTEVFFYKKGQGEWQKYRSGQNGLSCSEFDTASQDVKNAFMGSVCLTKSGETRTVQ